MCGRYASSRKPEDLVEEFEVTRVDVARPLEPDYNVAPTKEVYAVFDRKSKQAPEDEPAERRLKVVKWGLVPSWAKDPSIGNRMINARVETLSEKPAFRRALAARRCILPADGYYEWYPTQVIGKSGKPLKQPFFIRPSDGGVLAMAGLYEIWRNKEVEDEDAEGAFLWTCTVITTSAEDAVGHIHDRMPMLIEPERYDVWLGAEPIEQADLSRILVPAAPGRLEAFPVSTEVNDVRNNGRQLTAPVAPEGEPAALFES
jgi:putative SOS response-associated peptidase YedK